MLNDFDTVKLVFGLKIKHLRLEHGFSYQQLSQRTGLAISYLHDIEKGKKYPKSTAQLPNDCFISTTTSSPILYSFSSGFIASQPPSLLASQPPSFIASRPHSLLAFRRSQVRQPLFGADHVPLGAAAPLRPVAAPRGRKPPGNVQDAETDRQA